MDRTSKLLINLRASMFSTATAIHETLVDLMERNDVGFISFVKGDFDSSHLTHEDNSIRIGGVFIPQDREGNRYMVFLSWDDVMNNKKLAIFRDCEGLSLDMVDELFSGETIMWDYVYDNFDDNTTPLDTIYELSYSVEQAVKEYCEEGGGGYNPSNTKC